MGDEHSRCHNSLQRDTWKRIAVLLALATAGALAATAFAMANAGESPRGPSLAMLVGLDPAQANARLATARSVVSDAARPNMATAVYGLGITNAAEIFYGRAPDVPRPALSTEPKMPPNLNDFAKKVWKTKVRDPWQEERDAAVARWEKTRLAGARTWAKQRAANLVNVDVRSPHSPLTTSDVSVGVFRAGQFFAHAKGRSALVVIVDEMPAPPDNSVKYDLRDIHVVLVGWKTDHPKKFQTREAAWKAFFISQNAAPDVVVIARGLDSTQNIVAAIADALDRRPTNPR